MIFQQLEGEDLLNCEAVCRPWRDNLLTETPWRRLFHRQAARSPLWRYVQKKLVSNQTVRTEQYRGTARYLGTADIPRDICRNSLQVNRNWRTGNFSKSTYPMNRNTFHISMSDDNVVWYFNRIENEERREGCAFLDTEVMEITEIEMSLFLGLSSQNGKIFSWASNVVELRDPKNNWSINMLNEEEDGFRVRQISFGSKVLVCKCTSSANQERIRIWKMENPPTLIQDRIFEARKLITYKVDEQFIVAMENPLTCVARYDEVVARYCKTATFYFISTETLQEVRILTVMNCQWKYDQGLWFQFRDNGTIRILDVASGTHFNDVHLPFRKDNELGKYKEYLPKLLS